MTRPHVQSEDLRHRAEGALKNRGEGARGQTSEDIAETLHELEVHQVELEMQNEELNRAQVELLESRARYVDLYDLAPVGYLTLDENCKILEMNSTAAEMLKLERGRLLGDKLSRFTSADNIAALRAHVREIFADRSRKNVELQLSDAAGGSFWGRLESVAIEDQYTHRVSCHSSLLDITERRRADDALREREKRTRAILDAVWDAIVTIDSEGKIASANTAAEKMFGYSAQEMIGRSFQTMTTGVRERLGIRKNSSKFPIELAMSESSSDGWRFFTCVIRDVSERNRRDERIRRLATIVTDSNDAITVQDLNGKILSWNRGAEEMYGYRETDVLLTDILRLVPPSRHHEMRTLRDRVRVEHTVRSFETQRVTSDGRVLDVWLTASALFDDSGELAGIATTERDLTERKRLERQLVQAQKMEALGLLASTLAHEFNNLLMGVSGCLEAALRGLDENSAARAHVETAKHTVLGGATLTRELLSFGRKTSEPPSTLDLNVLIEESANMMRSLLDEGIELVLDLAAKESWITALKAELDRLLMNLIVNARDAIEGRGTITIRTRDAGPDPELGRCVALSVIDTGCGMDEHTRSRALEPFFTTKEPGRGTGLGLWTVYGIVKREGGRLQITSAPGQGTAISVHLPVLSGAAGAATRSTDLEGETQRATIMLVEDERLVRMAVRDYLERGGHEVIETASAEEALAAWPSRERPIDVLVTDVSLPRMLGSELAEKARELEPSLAVIFMSAFPEELLRREGRLPEGAVAIEKPFTSAELLAKVNGVLKNRAKFDRGE